MDTYQLLSASAFQQLVVTLIKLTEKLSPNATEIGGTSGDGKATIGYGLNRPGKAGDSVV
jgi:hypothetical protein